MGDTMDDAWHDQHSNDDHHEGWTPEDNNRDTCPIMGTALTDEEGQLLPF